MGEATDFLYPFLGGDGDDPSDLLADLTESARAKTATSEELKASTLAALGGAIGVAAADIAERFARGGRLLTFGNGGSWTDAAGLADLFLRPPWGASFPTRCLGDDQAVLTALANDVGFDVVFARQVIAHGTVDDIALGLSTSGGSRNVIAAFEEAHARGLLTVGLAGYEGGAMAESPAIDHLLIVRSDSVHRIQEGQSAVAFALWHAVQSHAPEPVHHEVGLSEARSARAGGGVGGRG